MLENTRISLQNSVPGWLWDRSWTSPRPRWASFWPTLAVPSALSRRPSVLEGLPGFKNYFFEPVTGQQKSKIRINLNFVCNRFVFLGFVSPKVLTFTCLLHFATTTCEKSKPLVKKSVQRSWNPAKARMLHTIYLAAAAGRSPLQYAAASRKPFVRCREKGCTILLCKFSLFESS